MCAAVAAQVYVSGATSHTYTMELGIISDATADVQTLLTELRYEIQTMVAPKLTNCASKTSRQRRRQLLLQDLMLRGLATSNSSGIDDVVFGNLGVDGFCK